VTLDDVSPEHPASTLDRQPPALSIVVLTYNSALTIQTCLDSLVNQEFADFETIVVDDDSNDDTVSVVSRYADRLRLSIVPNGSHNIPKGRNIGLDHSASDFVAFLDSDDAATVGWTKAIVKAFVDQPDLALIGGPLLPANRKLRAQAIGINDATVNHLIARGVMRYAAGNCALNRRILPGKAFDEEFRAAEDLELVARVQRHFLCSYEPDMQIFHTSRDSFRAYAQQMYRYGHMKMYFSFYERSYRFIDFIPLLVMLLSVVAAATTAAPWWVVLSIVPFSLAESLFVVAYRRCRPSIAVFTFPAWLTKNVAWSVGVGHGLFVLTIDRKTRRHLRSKHEAR
jgi:glycosyltransferase involved in cell wall biosynthesis